MGFNITLQMINGKYRQIITLLLGNPTPQSLVIVMILIGLVTSCVSAEESNTTTPALTTKVTETPSSVPSLTPSPTHTPQPTYTASPSPTFTATPTNTATPTSTPSLTPTPVSGPVVPEGWSIYEQADGIYAIGYPPDWQESPFPFSYNADLTLFPSNEPIFVKVEIALVYDPSGISVEGVVEAVGDGLSQDPSIELFPLEPVEISGHTGLVRNVELSEPGGENPIILPGRHYYFVNNGFSFIITILADESVFDTYVADFDAIISTLYFPPDKEG